MEIIKNDTGETWEMTEREIEGLKAALIDALKAGNGRTWALGKEIEINNNG